jgi:ABC-2 type transport system permease protein
VRARIADWRNDVRIVAAITAKDLLEALKNKNTVSILVSSLLMVAFYRWYPSIVVANEPLSLLVYDGGRSTLVAELKGSDILALYDYRSEAEMKERLADGEVAELGLVIPAGFDQALQQDGEATLQGYLMHWVSQQDALDVKRSAEAEISRLSKRPVAIQIEGNAVFPGPESDGLGVQAGIGLIYVAVMVGLMLVPHLLLEEKQGRTVDALLVSPAGAEHLVLAKALTGLFYCLVAAGIALAVNHDMILHWGVAVLSVVVGSASMVSFGLLLGARIEDRGQLTLWAWVFLFPLLIPIFLSLLDPLVPAVVIRACRIVPSTVLLNLFRASMGEPLSVGRSLLHLGYVAGWAVAVLGLVAWGVRRFDREPQAAPSGRAGKLARALNSPLSRSPERAATWLNTGPEAVQGAARQVPFQAASVPARAAGAAPLPRRPVSGRSIVWTIAAKDVREAIRSRLFLSILLGVAIMIATNALLPLLLRTRQGPNTFLLDEGGSQILRSLADSRQTRLFLVGSWPELKQAVSESTQISFGLVAGPDLDQKAQAGEPIDLAGYAVHWANPGKTARWAATIEEQLSAAAGTPVRIALGNAGGHADGRLFPEADAGGQPAMAAALLAIVICTLGSALVPLLIIEEKEAHTLDALLASPATLLQVVSGKALAGSLYCVGGAAVLLALNMHWIVSWGTAVVAALLSIAFVVAAGLTIGVLSDNPTTAGMWGALLLLSLLGLTGLAFLSRPGWPEWLRSLLAWLPGALGVNLIRFSMAGELPLARMALSSGALLAETACMLFLSVGLIRRRTR